MNDTMIDLPTSSEQRTPSQLLEYLRSIGVQLTLDGDTLRLNAPKGALTPALQAELRDNKPGLLELLRSLRQGNAQTAATGSMKRALRQPLMQLSFAQQRLWFLQQMDLQSTAYNLLSVMRLRGDIDLDVLERSLHAILLRHEVLRTCFVQRDGSPYTTIGDALDWTMARLHLAREEHETIEQAVTRFAESTTQKPFDLEKGQLLRAYLLEVHADEWILILSVHHIVSDGWSMGVLCQELGENYRAFRLEEKPRMNELSIQYADFTEWQREWLGSGVLDRQLTYWRKQLSGAPGVVLFPPDHSRSVEGAGRGSRIKLVLSAELTERLHAFSRTNDATLFMTMLSAFMLLLSRYSGLKDVVVGSPSANRGRAELSELIGFFVNNLVLRAEVEEGISFLDLLKRVRESTLGAYENQDVPFDLLVRELDTERNADRTPLFQTMFILQNFPLEELKLPGLTVSPLEIDASTARFDLTAEIYPYRKELYVYFDYRSDLYEEATIAALQRSFQHVLEFVLEHPEAAVESVPLQSPEATKTLLACGNPDPVILRPGSLLLDRFHRSVLERPNQIAAQDRLQKLSYSQLDAASDELAERLRGAGVTPSSLVPVCLNRSTQLLIALLAVLKTGAAYVPLDPIYPKHRIAGILEDVQPDVLITERSQLTLLSGYESSCLVVDVPRGEVVEAPSAENMILRDHHPTSEDLAYVIFTSGSTGKPKGVEISHGALANCLDSMRQEPGFTADDRVLAVTTMSFDIAGLELFLPLYVGGQCVIASSPGDLPSLLEDLERFQPTVMQATPALWQMLVSAGWEGDTNLVALCGGEALTASLAGDLLPKVEALWNMYGPTETTIWSSVLKVEDIVGASIPLGGPIQNTTFYVLDSCRQPVPIGVTGELYIGGEGLARGYFHRPDLTIERFLPAPFAASERLYRTGDLVRRHRDGALEFLGRADFQVKLRGFRIELGEIEHVLRQQPEVAESVVLLREEGVEKELVAYLVLRPGESLSYQRLRQRLRERLPEYMVPANSVILPAFPRLPNGKLDRSKLPAPMQDAHPIQESPLSAEGNRTEAAIAKVFRELLQTPGIGIHQRFFDAGAHSLLLVKAHDRLRKELDPDLRLVSFFQYPTIAALAAHIDQNRAREREVANVGRE
jgi:amino acid adenylation domain-containing protein